MKIIRKTGERPIVFSKIKMVAFRGSGIGGFIRHDKAFTKFLVNKYYKSSPLPLRLSAIYYMIENQ
ncbi:MAG: hypothetical protein ABIN24_12860 [Dyadobacter sp.]